MVLQNVENKIKLVTIVCSISRWLCGDKSGIHFHSS